uniref:Vomeronasal type-2 receptor 116-like n=1 Tax=Jaculus jaculus TaxID=51337 RepID=A0A8C5L0C7_JACJA
FQFVVALFSAIKEINSNPYILPNISLIYPVHGNDDFYPCNIFPVIFVQSRNISFPNYMCEEQISTVAGLIGPMCVLSAKLKPLMKLFRWPQLSFAPFHPILSDREHFPNIYQMAPKDTSLPLAMVTLMLHFHWNWVGLLISDDEQGTQFLSELRAEMQGNRVCLAFVSIIPMDIKMYLGEAGIHDKYIMTSSSANVVIIYGEVNPTLTFSYALWTRFGSHKIWLSTSQWEYSTIKRDFNHDSLLGTFTFSHHHPEISGFKTFIQTVNLSNHPLSNSSAKWGWVGLNCSELCTNCKAWNNCSLSVSLELLMWHRFDMAMSDESYNLYNAVYAVAHSLHEMLLRHVDTQPVKYGKELKFEPWQFSSYLKKIQFTNPAGDPLSMNQEENSHVEYDIFSIWKFEESQGVKVKIGQFTPYFSHGQQLYLSEDAIIDINRSPNDCLSCAPGFRKSPQEGKAVCCFDCTPCPENEISNETDLDQCVKCPVDQYANTEQTRCLHKVVTFLAYDDPLGMTLACTSLFFSALTAVVLGVFVKHQDTPIVKANNRTLTYILLLSLIFSFLCSFFFIGRPNTATCILQQTAFAVVFTVAVSTVLAKTITVVLAFKVTAPGKRMRCFLVSGALNFIIPICTLIQLILCVIWLGTSPPFIDTDTHTEHGYIMIVCNTGSATAFYCVLGYLGSLAIVSFTVAFLARNLPDTFNEAKFLTFSMLVFCSVWVTFLPVHHSTRGKVMVAMEVLSILTSSAGLLVCIFAPKCFIILFRPERNSLQKFRHKAY